jgi:hypothetical protein
MFNFNFVSNKLHDDGGGRGWVGVVDGAEGQRGGGTDGVAD